MAINLSKGQKINLSKDSGLTQVRLGLGWDPIKVKGFFGRNFSFFFPLYGYVRVVIVFGN